MKNYMPLAHDSRRLVREYLAGNPFVGIDRLAAHLDEMQEAYLRTSSIPVACALKCEIDHIETIL